MITHSYDISTPPITSPGMFYGARGDLCKTCIVTFSEQIFKHALEAFPHKQIAEIGACNGNKPIYLLDTPAGKVAIYLSSIGATGAGNEVIESSWITGAENYIFFGSAGTLDSAKTRGRYVIPTAAYRDEGMSYHYAPPADYIEMNGADIVAKVFDELRVPCVRGRVWTTDAFYRETRGQMEARRNEGCIAVEMELAGVQAVCDFHDLRLYAFLQAGDALDLPTYDFAGLPGANHDLEKFYLALEIAKRI